MVAASEMCESDKFSEVFKDPFSNSTEFVLFTAQKMKFSIKNLFSKCDQIRSFFQIWSHFLKKSLMENFIFCAVLPKRLCFLFKSNIDRVPN